jgi:hypothetical protein
MWSSCTWVARRHREHRAAASQIELVDTVTDVGKPTVVVVSMGRPQCLARS